MYRARAHRSTGVCTHIERWCIDNGKWALFGRPNEVLPGEQACSLSPIVAARYSGNNAPTPSLHPPFSEPPASRCICSIWLGSARLSRPPARCLPRREPSYPPRVISDFKSGHCPRRLCRRVLDRCNAIVVPAALSRGRKRIRNCFTLVPADMVDTIWLSLYDSHNQRKVGRFKIKVLQTDVSLFLSN